MKPSNKGGNNKNHTQIQLKVQPIYKGGLDQSHTGQRINASMHRILYGAKHEG